MDAGMPVKAELDTLWAAKGLELYNIHAHIYLRVAAAASACAWLQVVSTALPESKNPEQVSVAVKSFMGAGLQAELIELLEKIVLQNSSFSNNHNLQNLLIITAIKVGSLVHAVQCPAAGLLSARSSKPHCFAALRAVMLRCYACYLCTFTASCWAAELCDAYWSTAQMQHAMGFSAALPCLACRGSSLAHSCFTGRCRLPQADKSRVKDYIHRLDNFDGPAVGEIAVGYEMFEEAFEIYKKFSLKTQAIKVLLDQMDDLPRALEYANKVRSSSNIRDMP